MNLKAWSVVLMVPAAVLTFNQVSYVAAAQGGNPITSPITFPQPTPTATPPITFPRPTSTPVASSTPTPVPSQTPAPTPAPIVKYQVKGHVDYVYNKWFRFPAKVQVEVINLDSGFHKYIFTDIFGNYSVDLKSGKYSISVHDRFGTKFVPDRRVVRVTNSNVTGVNFEGKRKLW